MLASCKHGYDVYNHPDHFSNPDISFPSSGIHYKEIMYLEHKGQEFGIKAIGN